MIRSLLLALAMVLAPACNKDDTDETDIEETDTDDTDAGPVTEDGCEARHEAFIAALEADLADATAPGVNAAIMEGGVVTCRVARGVKTHGGDEPVDVETLFQIGSTTKMFTSLALLQQVEDGDLSLDNTLAEAYPSSEFARNADWNDQITLHHLISNQGGAYDYIDWTATSDDAGLKSWHEGFFFPQLWLMAEPGEFWNYSNPNFTLAGLVVEHTDGRIYRDVMAEDVFAPLGMTRTVQGNDRAAELGNVASGYGLEIVNGATRTAAVSWDASPDAAAGRPAGINTWSTPRDVLQMVKFLDEGDSDVLSDALRREMVTAQVGIPDQPGAGYGYGMFVYSGATLGESYYAVPVWSHGGNTLTYTSELFAMPDQDVAVSILSSGYGQDFPRATVEALKLADLPAPTDAPVRDFDASKLELHLGEYTDANNWGRMIITRDGEGLGVSMPDLADLGYTVNPKLQTWTDATFVATVEGQTVPFTFVGEADEPSTYMVNRSAVGTRSETPQTFQPPETLELAGQLHPVAPMPGPGVSSLAPEGSR